MNPKERLYLFMEFFRPASAGAYFDGEKLHLHGGERKPARLYIAVSHKELYFGRLNVSGLNRKHIMKAAKLEALRLLSLMDMENVSPVVTAFSIDSEIIFAFREKNFFEKILSNISAGFVPCGVFPAGLTLLPPEPKDGVYAFFSKDRCEGLVIERGRIKDFLPVDPEAAGTFVEEYQGEKFVKQGDPVEYIAASAPNIVKLPSELWLAFPPYRINIRPQLSLRTVLFFLLPVAALGAHLHIQDLNRELEVRLNRKEGAISLLKKELQGVAEEIVAYERQKKAKEELSKFKNQKRDVYAILKDLTEIFPEGAWVNRFNLDLSRGELKLNGEAEDILAVVKNLKKLPWVAEVKLPTVTRNPSTDKERFHLTIQLTELQPSE